MWLDSRLLPYLAEKTIGWDYSHSDRHTHTDTGRRYAKLRYENITEPGMKASHVGSAQPPAPSSPLAACSYLGPQGAEPASVT